LVVGWTAVRIVHLLTCGFSRSYHNLFAKIVRTTPFRSSRHRFSQLRADVDRSPQPPVAVGVSEVASKDL